MKSINQAKMSYEPPFLYIIKPQAEVHMKHFSFVNDGHGGIHEIDDDDPDGMANEDFGWDDYTD